MHSISIYGAGHLTKTLLKGLSLITDEPVKIYNRTYNNILALKDDYKHIVPFADLSGFINEKSFIFLIIPPDAIMKLDKNFIQKVIASDSVLVSCGYFNTIHMLDKAYPGLKIIRLSPNINWQIARGVTIYSKNSQVNNDELRELLRFIRPITTLIEAQSDDDFDKLGKLTSCGPALFIDIIENLCDSFGITEKEQRTAVYTTVEGVFDKALKTGKQPSEIIAEVANKGGITESGVSAMNSFLPDVFSKIKDKMIERTEFVKNSL